MRRAGWGSCRGHRHGSDSQIASPERVRVRVVKRGEGWTHGGVEGVLVGIEREDAWAENEVSPLGLSDERCAARDEIGREGGRRDDDVGRGGRRCFEWRDGGRREGEVVGAIRQCSRRDEEIVEGGLNGWIELKGRRAGGGGAVAEGPLETLGGGGVAVELDTGTDEKASVASAAQG